MSASQRFGVSASSAIRWRALERRQGDARSKALGGDRALVALSSELPAIAFEETANCHGRERA